MTENDFMSEHDIRTAFFQAMSQMYRTEVPLYGDLLDIVDDVNGKVLAGSPDLELDLRRRGELDRLGQERHGAIRVGTAAELSMMRRVFAVMGMHPVGYYDLSVAGVPVHSTAFRPVKLEGLNRNPFRVFTSLLRLELIDDHALRAEATKLLSQRKIFTDRAIALVEQFERDGGLDGESATEFVREVLETFRWHSDTVVDSETYEKLHDVHRLIADVACFRGPHINHLTPRTLDIDAAQEEMQARGINAKDVIEGPPRREVPILLRQTSFKALEEEVRFNDGANGVMGTHTARFGEIEQRGLALTPKGRALYDTLLDAARGEEGSQAHNYEQRLQEVFARFPDDLNTLRQEGLGYFNYRLADSFKPDRIGVSDLEALIAGGVVEASPVIYEDFLPVSAAGVFQSNLGGTEQRSYSATEAQADFEKALGANVADPFTLYEAMEAASMASVRAALGAATASDKR
ncbi:2-oxoadipate dioxygenase/decarboxylase HglS [Nocardia sp. bgisy118]|uniref:2-oxoadipate dioxygenase/decarboxylase HglS n=1 Tax=Nocardia sp. bgisy118 TaxID=3413786 RepID=UPI003F4A55C2